MACLFGTHLVLHDPPIKKKHQKNITHAQKKEAGFLQLAELRPEGLHMCLPADRR